MIQANKLTGSSELKFHSRHMRNPKLQVASIENDQSDRARESTGGLLPSSNRLIHNDTLYFSEPDELRKYIDSMVPSHAFCLVLSNKLAEH